METLSVIGAGFVGSAVANGFKEVVTIKIYDIDPQKSTHSLEECLNSDFIFICLPTPMNNIDKNADLSIIFNFFDKIKINSNSLFVIKSTVPIGTIKFISEKYNIKNIVHNPEFLTAKNAFYDFLHPDRVVIGGSDDKNIMKLVSLYRLIFPYERKNSSDSIVPIFIMSSNESEMVKYMSNAFLSTKLSFFNEMRILSDKKEMNWKNVIEGVTADKRIGKSHSIIADDIKNRFFSGPCFIKDINAFIKSFEKEGIDPIVLKSVWELNERIRNVK